jgi:DNA-directed RNA polymerase specialized sigma24 family protein
VPDSWDAWLTTVTTRVAYSLINKDQTYDRYVDRLQAESQQTTTHRPGTIRRSQHPEDPVGAEVAQRDFADRLREVLAKRPIEEATIVHLKLVDDWTNVAIGKQIGRTGQHVGKVLKRVLPEFAKELEVNEQ